MAEEVQAREEVEVKLREAEGAQVALRGQLTEAQGQLGAATERLAAMEAALREKSEQVATLKELMLALRVSMQEANDVLVRDTQGALERAAAEQGRALAAAVDQVAATKEAAVRSSQTLDGLTAQQRAMAEELSRITLDNTSGMQMLRGELDATRSQLQAADAERRTLGRQVLAAGALSRVEDRRHQKLLKVIMSDLPERLAGQLTAEFKVLQEQTGSILAGLRGANNQLTQTLGAGAPGPYGTSTMPRLNAYADDSAAVVMLEQSRALRSQLHALLMHETGAA